MSILDELDIDPEDFSWQQLSTCSHLPDDINPLRLMFEDYQNDESLRPIITAMCDSCPVKDACLESGTDNREYGVWGGVFLEDGKPK